MLDIILGISATFSRRQTSTTRVQIGKDEKLALFAVDAIAELGNVGELMLTFAETIEELSKGAGY